MTQKIDFAGDERKSHVGGVVRQVGEKLKKFIRSRVRSEADAEDVLQDVWQQLLVTLEDGPIDHIAAWLYTVARNRIIDQYRKPPVASLDELDAAFDLRDFASRHDAVNHELNTEFWNQLHAALATLPPEQSQVFIWHELDGLSFQQIAQLTGENLNTLLARKRYAVLHLRKHFEPMRDEFFT